MHINIKTLVFIPIIAVSTTVFSGCGSYGIMAMLDEQAEQAKQDEREQSLLSGEYSENKCSGKLKSSAPVDQIFERMNQMFPGSFVPRKQSHYADIVGLWNKEILAYDAKPRDYYYVAGFVPNGIIKEHWHRFYFKKNPKGGTDIHYNTIGYEDCADTHLVLSKRLAQGFKGKRTW